MDDDYEEEEDDDIEDYRSLAEIIEDDYGSDIQQFINAGNNGLNTDDISEAVRSNKGVSGLSNKEQADANNINSINPNKARVKSSGSSPFGGPTKGYRISSV